MHQQRLLPCRADTRHFVQRACSHGLASLRTMGPDGETVRLVTQALQVEENGVVHWQGQFAPIHQVKHLPPRIPIRPFGDHDKRSEEHTSELQSLMRISYAVFCLNKNKKKDMKKTSQY